ncbi:S26 family signal peptidase [Actinomadura kijaniata]|uniref:S26 family signal peptidase n=1 Tax=Actinomadura kijaniata TaxID=46161 RepID=UPI00083498E6|nr:S26 family signal peptidase [Actinomadura kijaniata]
MNAPVTAVLGAVVAILCAGWAAAGLLRRHLVIVTVRGSSMEPSFHDGDRVLVRRTRSLTAGQVVVVEGPDGDDAPAGPPLDRQDAPGAVSARNWMIKRVAAGPGDPVPRERVPLLADTPDGVVPEGRVILLGDNHRASYDSRHLGFFPVERVLGTALAPSARRRRTRGRPHGQEPGPDLRPNRT